MLRLKLPLEVSWWRFSRPSHNSPDANYRQTFFCQILSNVSKWLVHHIQIFGWAESLVWNGWTQDKDANNLDEWVLASWLKSCFVFSKILVKIVDRISNFFPAYHYHRTWTKAFSCASNSALYSCEYSMQCLLSYSGVVVAVVVVVIAAWVVIAPAVSVVVSITAPPEQSLVYHVCCQNFIKTPLLLDFRLCFEIIEIQGHGLIWLGLVF